MLTKLCLSVYLLSSSVFGLPVEDNGLVGLPRFAMDMDMEMNGEDRIYVGREAAIGQFPHQVSLRIPSFGHFCGGSLLNERFILTAGHCVNEPLPNGFHVVVGAHEKNGNDGTAYKVKQFVYHEDLLIILNNETTIVRNDIALVQTDTPIQFTNLIRPIPLHPGFILTEKSVTSGWGRTNDRIKNLKFLNVKTLTNDECRRVITARQPHPPPPVRDFDTICVFSGRSRHGICNGDSGGPLVRDNQLIGITSWAFGCGAGLPDGFTRVSPYIDWINENMQKLQDN